MSLIRVKDWQEYKLIFFLNIYQKQMYDLREREREREDRLRKQEHGVTATSWTPES